MQQYRQDTATFRLLFVCTGNICRSPFAEMITRHLLVGRLGHREAERFVVSSAGVNAVVGAQMHPDTRDELMPWRLDGTAAGLFAARQLRISMIMEADVVLGATRRHRGVVAECVPSAMPIAFSMREFARLVGTVDPAVLPDDPVKRALTLVERAHASRGLKPVGPDEDRIPDPIGQRQQVHHEAARLIFEAARTIVDQIAPARTPVAD